MGMPAGTAILATVDMLRVRLACFFSDCCAFGDDVGDGEGVGGFVE